MKTDKIIGLAAGVLAVASMIVGKMSDKKDLENAVAEEVAKQLNK